MFSVQLRVFLVILFVFIAIWNIKKLSHKNRSRLLTTVLVSLICFLLFKFGFEYQDPPEEYGVAINFGNSAVGSGNIQPTEPIKSRVNDEVVKEVKQTEKVEEVKTPSEASSNAEDVMTAESAEAIAIKKAKEAKVNAEAKAKADADRKEKLRKEAETRKAKEEQDKKDKLDALIGGVKNAEGNQTGGEGPGDGPGDKGQLDGDPYAPSYFGGSGPGKGGVGSGLGGRGTPTKTIYKQDCNEYGLVVVKIVVNNQGKVISAEPGIRGTTNTHPCLLAPAKKIALSHKWPSDSKAPNRQVGFVSINFDVSQ